MRNLLEHRPLENGPKGRSAHASHAVDNFILSRSSIAQYSRRVNQALQFLNRPLSPAEVVTRLAAQLGVSTRQAARYVQAAQQQSVPVSIPEAKDVFTVKLPKSLIRRVRQRARAQDRPISDWVAQALEEQLRGVPRHG